MPADDERLEEHYAYDTVIPACVLFNFSLTDREKILYGLLRNMANSRGYAYPRNARLCKFFGGISEDTVGRMLRHLEAAKAIRVENGKGGRTLRKIFVGEVYSVNPRTDAEVNPRTDAEVIIKGNKNKKERKTGRAAAASQEEIIEWLDAWAAKLELPSDETVRLCRDLHAMVENRAAKGKPYNTINAAGLMTNRLLAFCEGTDFPSARMRYILQESIAHNWEKIFPVKDDHIDDYYAFLQREYGVERHGSDPEPEGSELVWG